MSLPSLHDITRQYKAVFFDLDGTLFNSEPLHANALVKSAANLDIDLSGMNPLHDFLGLPDPGVYRLLDKMGRVPETASQEAFIAAKNSYYLADCREMSEHEWFEVMTPGAREFLVELKKSEILIALVTASEESIVESMLRHSGLNQFFDNIVARGVCFRSKPSPGPYMAALRHWKLKSHEAIVFEDSPTGKKAAQLAGCKVIALTCFTQPANDDLDSIDNFFRLI
tara:strand:- start:822 stop:1499 length:678 start_codon:yes stop_codon:yes gene_type:complete